ncbi:MAG: heme ABC exporter ATP-binding protein CcmA [Chloroflexi bacterium]|nr:heme ABC exporter ATP-binding protein CcmA [Chloroflexota bacterium]
MLGGISRINTLLEINSLSKSYSKNLALDCVNFELNPGEIVSILGDNGAGKTTLLKLLAGVIKKDSGDVKYNGIQFEKLGQSVRGKIGFLMHDSMMYNGMTAFENLQFYARIYNISPFKDRINEVVDMMGVEAIKNIQISKMSHGQKKRFSIARSILHNPEILLMDEPETGLDSEGLIRLKKIIYGIRDEEFGTSLIATHNLDFAYTISDKIMFLSKGRLIRINSTDSMSLDRFKEIYSDFLNQVVE